LLGVRIEGQAILQGFISTFAESADEAAQPPHLSKQTRQHSRVLPSLQPRNSEAGFYEGNM